MSQREKIQQQDPLPSEGSQESVSRVPQAAGTSLGTLGTAFHVHAPMGWSEASLKVHPDVPGIWGDLAGGHSKPSWA